MSRGSLPVVPTHQERTGDNTLKGQRGTRIGDEYDPIGINAELDYVHERLNNIVLESTALDDLSGSATLGNVITRLNAITDLLRNAGLIRQD